MILGYGVAFYCLSLVLNICRSAWSMPSGLVLSMLVTLFGWLFYQQKIDLTALFGISLIASGVHDPQTCFPMPVVAH